MASECDELTGSRLISLSSIEERIRRHQATGIPSDVAPRRAAVAVVVREGSGGAEILLMQRTIRSGDRWSGQVSLPGGREEAGDESLIDTAVRETREEVAVDLSESARLIGQLNAIQARSRAGLAGMSVWPYVFVAAQALEPQPSAEAEAVFWLPASLVLSGELDDVYPYQVGGDRYELPCWRYQERIVWGMTHRMLSDFLELLEP